MFIILFKLCFSGFVVMQIDNQATRENAVDLTPECCSLLSHLLLA